MCCSFFKTYHWSWRNWCDISYLVNWFINLLMGTLKLQCDGLLYSNIVISTLAVDGWKLVIWYSKEGPDM